MNASMHASKDDKQLAMASTKADYLAAVFELFRLLELPAEQKTPDHRQKLMDANNECGVKRAAMIEAWAGEDVPPL